MSWLGNMISTVKEVFNPPAVVEEVVEEVKKEKPDLKNMTKKQLESYGRSLGIELDRRQKKAKLIARLEEAIAR